MRVLQGDADQFLCFVLRPAFYFRELGNDFMGCGKAVAVFEEQDVFGTVVANHFIHFAFVLGVFVINANGITAVGVDEFHAGDVGVAIANIDHVPEGHAHVFRFEGVILRHSRALNHFFEPR